MNDRLLADAVLVAHLAFIVFVFAGGLLVARWPRLAWLHLPALTWGIYVELTATICPLTPLENALRHAAGDAGYAGGFIEHYVARVIYPPGLTPAIQLALGAALVAVNAVLYGIAWRRRRRPRGAPA